VQTGPSSFAFKYTVAPTGSVSILTFFLGCASATPHNASAAKTDSPDRVTSK
jgi:hypothetical protein